jgi:hypothetical protein
LVFFIFSTELEGRLCVLLSCGLFFGGVADLVDEILPHKGLVFLLFLKI